jgi:hypothetical protein
MLVDLVCESYPVLFVDLEGYAKWIHRLVNLVEVMLLVVEIASSSRVEMVRIGVWRVDASRTSSLSSVAHTVCMSLLCINP